MIKWKILFWFVLITTVGSFISLPFKDSISIADFVALFYGGILAIPYYGYSYQKPIGNSLMWKLVFALLCITTIPFVGNVAYLDIQRIITGDAALIRSAFLLIFLGFIVVFFLAPYRYAFKSKDIWDKNL